MITNTPTEKIHSIVARQRDYFRSNQTLDIAYRMKMLRRLRDAIKMYEADLA